jgi:iron complex outermembrane receptor protein
MTSVSIGVLTSSYAVAQVDEIVVTATRQEESLQEVPISVTALSGEAIEERSLDDIVQFARATPNLVSTNGAQGSNDANFFIRGVGQFDFTLTNDPGVGIYVDGIYLGRTVGALLDVEDVERIEVLRGPQGTLFGRNTLGGAVNVVTPLPDLTEASGRIQLTTGSRDRFDATGVFNLPISDTQGLRVTLLSLNQDGWAERVSTGATLGDQERLAGKAVYLWRPNERFDLVLRGDYSADNGTPIPSINAGLNPMAQVPPGSINPLAAQDRSDDPYDNFSSIPPVSEAEAWGVSATADYLLGNGLTFRSISAYRGIDVDNWQDYDGTRWTYYDGHVRVQQRQFSQELQLFGTNFDNRLDWIAGLYYFNEDAEELQDLNSPTLLPFGCVPFGPFANCVGGLEPGQPSPAVWNQAREQTVEAYAAFGQATLRLTDRLAVTAGLRYTEEEKAFDTTQKPANALPPTFAPPMFFTVADQATFTDLSPRFSVEYQATPDALVYASYSRGFRSGGFNGRLLTPQALVTFDSDINNTYEVGLKSDLFNNMLRFNAAAFVTRYDDIQQSVTDPELFFRIANASEAEINGFEIESTFAPTDSLSFDLGVGYTDSEITDIDDSLIVSGVQEGNRLAFAPEWTINAGGQYVADLPNGSDLTFRADYFYMSEHFFSPVNSPLEREDGYGLVNLRATWTSPDERLQLSAFGINVTDEEYFTFGQDATAAQGVAYLHVGQPAEWGLTATLNF